MNGLTDDLEFENELEEMATDQKKLNMFLARKVHYMSKNCTKQDDRILALENQSKKTTAAISGVSATLGGAVVILAEFIRRIV